ncbi:MAG TPA: SDR family NAD(P)-dependent oxidoreductase [Pseudonocardiaceae bacterium]|nr:SDR family NAD(P)-dependent oxidoreductase [Pseudonocardiaceae bacterium]
MPPACGPGTGPPSTDTSDELESLVLLVVAEITGYPVEILQPHMELEADLGIDSITRVQILAELANRLPWLAEKAQQEEFGGMPQLASLRTAADVALAIRELNSPDTAADPAGADPGHTDGIVRQVTMAVQSPARGEPMPGLGQGLLFITPAVAGIADPLAAKLVAHGVAAEVTDDVPADACGVVILTGLADINSPEEALAIQRHAFRTTRTLAAHMAENGGLLVIVQDTGGCFGPCPPSQVARAWSGGLAALARTAAREWPKASVKAIDCDRGNRDASAIAHTIADELLHGAADPDVGLAANGTRFVLDRRETPLVGAPAAVDLGPEDVLLVTGGGRGITAAAVRELARSSRRTRFVLVGRTPLTEEPAGLAGAETYDAVLRRLADAAGPEPRPAPASLRARTRRILAVREIRATLAALADAGCPARYLSLDVRDAEALHTGLEGIRTDWGPITGVLHGAGVPADQRLTNKTDSQFDEVFGTKTEGLRAVLSATTNDPLRLLCVFSSIAGRFGFVGQSDYAMANETLDHVLAAEHTRRPNCTVRALQWGPWQGGMFSPVLQQLLGRAGIRLITPQDGARAFMAELASSAVDPRVMLTTTPHIDRTQVALAP